MPFIYAFLILIAASLIYMTFEAGFVQVVRIAYPFQKAVFRTPYQFSSNKKPIKILQISDIHIRFLRVSSVKLNKIIKYENPDIIICTGDFIDKASDIGKLSAWLEKLEGRSRMYTCFGNHDRGAFIEQHKDKSGATHFFNKTAFNGFRQVLENTGVTILENETICLVVARESTAKDFTAASPALMQLKIHLTGITDYRNAAAGKNRNDTLNSLMSQGSGKDDEYAGIPNIAFTHNPDIVEELPASLFDLVLCGHYHGGQIWAPFDLEFRMLRNDNLSRKGIKRGLHKVNGMDIYINRGLGNVLVPLRFMSRPEVTVFEITI